VFSDASENDSTSGRERLSRGGCGDNLVCAGSRMVDTFVVDKPDLRASRRSPDSDAHLKSSGKTVALARQANPFVATRKPAGELERYDERQSISDMQRCPADRARPNSLGAAARSATLFQSTPRPRGSHSRRGQRGCAGKVTLARPVDGACDARPRRSQRAAATQWGRLPASG